MTRILTQRRLRWAVPALVTAAVAATAVITTSSGGASGQPTLPPTTAAHLLAAVHQAQPPPFSGTVVATTSLGLPDLPSGEAGGDGLSLQSLLTGSHTMRIWYDGPTRQRLAILAPMAELDVIHDGADLWTFQSTTNHVTHARRSGPVPTTAVPTTAPPTVPELTPQQAAEQALRAISPSTVVTVGRTAEVAGRSTYQLQLVPRDRRSLIASIRIAVDAATSMPLRVQIFSSRSSTPAMQIGFTSISFTTPSRSVFQFRPPAGATVTQRGRHPGGPGATGQTMPPGAGPSGGRPVLLGSGWTAVVELPGGGPGSDSTLAEPTGVSKPVPGGRLITTALVSVLITPDGAIFAGPVSGAALQRVAATGHGL